MKFLLRTHGCRANQYDSDFARRLLVLNGAIEVEDAEEADVAIYNSCSVTAAAEADLRKDIRHAARVNPRLRSIVMGCAPGVRARDERLFPLRTLPTVSDTVIGADFDELAVALGLPRRLPDYKQTASRALLRIQDGCDEHCTFCVTTIARGSNRSRSLAELTNEAAILAEQHREIVLTGIHIGSYGLDMGSSLSALVEALITRVPEVRVRLSSLEATEVDDRLAELYSEPDRLAPHLHAPLQSGSNAVLKRMGRHWYSAESYAESVRRVIDSKTVFALGADVMTGFPGETEDDHRTTMDLIEALPFTYLHVFKYSPRPGTSATRLANQIGSVVAERRSAELRDLALQKSRAYAAAREGRQADVIAISSREGLTEDYLSVDFTEPVAGRRARLKCVLSAGDHRLRATPLATFLE
jgi:threonylcarbamoyladenosine tRNA methylthiotransferase MtaB